MEIKELKKRTHFNNQRLSKLYRKFTELINELRSQPLNTNVVSFINEQIDIINGANDEKTIRKHVRIGQQRIIKLVEKEHKIVPKNYYRNLWMVLGMSAFGVSLGTAFGVALGNVGLLGVGIPFGMIIGIAIGTSMDKKAAQNGRQLKFDLSK